jgi:hypothetical protein
MTAPQTRPPRDEQSPDISGSVGEAFELVKTYAKQETLGPLKGAAQWVAWGAGGALLLGLGLTIMILGFVRMVQTEWGTTDGGSWSWIPYLIGILLCVGFAALAISRINRDTLNEEPK